MKLTIINSVRTNNFNDNLVMQKITGLWEDAYKRITTPDSIIYGVYHNYESNYQGDYTLSIAIEDSKDEPSIEIPDSAKYKIFNVDTKDEQGIINTWKEIWNLEQSGTLKRAYSFDFEKYYPTGKIEIYIAIS
ncbi:GyrI-like domain-containing protein [Bacillus alkalicellulosilyticus]|uniref:GyrI-like domain-containing protein n=1 Tax=Alkalihalobacterium alkalicellulosilyticum TaxID=1912214 RepID=UPI000998BC77|nr:effector binding domain-containing protein [Bacillus alkalicellulosilyticus]